MRWSAARIRGRTATPRESRWLTLRRLAPWLERRLGDRVTDRRARKPSGRRAREVYGAPDVHEEMRRAVLDALDPGPDDRLLDIGCGGGMLLRDALATGCTAAGVDHSAEMVRLARETNAEAVAAGRLQVVHADAARLPFEDAAFTRIAMVIVFLFLPDPRNVLTECHRVLRPAGRLALYTIPPELKGHPYAAPEPMASRGRFYTDAELDELARGAGFADVTVTHDQLLVARKGP
jgi:ubiquinone/menaquinone biosynthesis C-methylase UbiE